MSYCPANYSAARQFVSSALQDTSLSVSSRGLLAIYGDLANLNDDRPCIFASTSTMLKKTCWSSPTYRKHRDALVDAGYLIREDGPDGRVYLWFNLEKIFPEGGENNFPRIYKEEKNEGTQQTGPCAPLDDGGTAQPPRPKPKPLPKPKPAQNIPDEVMQSIEDQVRRGTANGRIFNPPAYRRTLVRMAHEGRYEPPPTPQTAKMEPYRPSWLDDGAPNCRNSAEERRAIGEICGSFLRGVAHA